MKRFPRNRVPVSLFAAGLLAAAACGAAGTGGQTGSQTAGDPEAAGHGETATEETAMPDTSIAAAQVAQEALTPTVMALPGVVGTAVGLCDDVPCIKVYLARRDEELIAQIPDMYRGFKVDIEVSGEFEAQDTSP